VPSAEIIAWTSLLASTRSSRAFSTLRILPRMGRIAWVAGSRPLRGRATGRVPLNDEQFALLRVRRGAVDQLAGQAPTAEQPLAVTREIPGLAGSHRACDGRGNGLTSDLFTLSGFFSNHSPSWSFTSFCTNVFASVLPSLVFVWPSNCGSRSFTLMIAVRPSRMSSPVRFASFSFNTPHSRAKRFISAVNAAR
jgi:hypothetical protein